MTSRIGNSFAQLLTSSAVLIAVGLAAVGGGRGLMFIGAVEARRRGGGLLGGRVLWGSDGESASELGFGVSFWFWMFSVWDEGEGLIVGVGGPEGKGVVAWTSVLVWDVDWLVVSVEPYRWDFGTRIEARRRTVRWCARVASAFKVRKKRYCTMIGVREMNVVARDGSFSRRAQVR